MGNEPSRIIVVDDEPGIREFLGMMLNKIGYMVETVADGSEAINRMENNLYDLAVLDIVVPTINGIDLLRTINEKSPETSVIMITAYASHETALEAMKLGAYDYIAKPFKIDELKKVIEEALEKKKSDRKCLRLKKEMEKQYGFGHIIGNSPSMLGVFDLIKKVSKLNVNVIISGESGTGKELVALAIHHSGIRHAGPFVPVNCGALPDSLIESELFGYRRGAFTGALRDKKGIFEIADGGTILLDEIGELSPHLQVKLLRAIEEKKIRPLGASEDTKVDLRVIAATNKKIEEEVLNGNFREDLFYRLNVIKISLPPLRERKEDIPLLVLHFINKYSKEMGTDIHDISRAALSILESYQFPGNVRELENIIVRCIALENADLILPETLPNLVYGENLVELDNYNYSKMGLDTILNNVEKQLLGSALKASKGNKTEAAKNLGISLRSLRYRLSKHEISTSQMHL
ncbi:MAG TPA: sigma-54 dependent transcriptional regulator [Thermodesulfobacteriota bacterium]